jgi:cytochrome c-type biogenesis protein CcmH/NrfF
MPRTGLALLAVCATLLVQADPALAMERCPRTTELAMESKVMCQVCGVPLLVADSLEADRERVFIKALVNRCDSVGQIEAAMVAQYGPGILATPGTHGFAITAWLVPAIAIGVAASGIAALLVPVRRRRRPDVVPSDVAADASSAEEARLDAALSAYRAGR